MLTIVSFGIHRFAENFGMDEEILRDIIRNRSESSDINAYGNFDALMASVDRTKSKAFLEKQSGTSVPPFKVTSRVNAMTREFIEGF